MELRRSGFTIAEFVISLMVMFIIMGSVITVTFKKAKQTINKYLAEGYEVCDCTSGTDYCLITIDNNSGRNEFYTIQILGGGAAGSAEKGGAAGETKIVHYPTLNGQYYIKLGAGGEYGGENINGGNTAIYKVLENGKFELLEFAMGGVGSKEKIDIASLPPGVSASDLAKGEQPNFEASSADEVSMMQCGAGGDAGRNGTMGGVIIKW